MAPKRERSSSPPFAIQRTRARLSPSSSSTPKKEETKQVASFLLSEDETELGDEAGSAAEATREGESALETLLMLWEEGTTRANEIGIKTLSVHLLRVLDLIASVPPCRDVWHVSQNYAFLAAHSQDACSNASEFGCCTVLSLRQRRAGSLSFECLWCRWFEEKCTASPPFDLIRLYAPSFIHAYRQERMRQLLKHRKGVLKALKSVFKEVESIKSTFQ